VIVCPSTLLATVRTVAHLWRQEHQNRNAQEIARQCASLYDKFVGFVEDLDKVGQRLEQAQISYTDAVGKLKTGRGNLIRTAENVKKLGVKPNKSLPTKLTDFADDDE
jgi:DNA recombination protein RmuC